MPHYFHIFFSLVLLVLLPDEQKYPGNTDENFTDLTGSWQLLVDDYVIEEKNNVVRTYHPFEKYPDNPVLVADKPWEGRTSYVYGSVLPTEEGTAYRMWYQAWTGDYVNLYATSKDGLTWEKPDLGIVDYQGTKANNLFLHRTREDHTPQVLYTPWEENPARRYKLLNFDYGRTAPDHLISGFWGAYSADGIHWQDAARNPVLKDPGDVSNFIWDSHKERYTGYPKVFAPVRGFNRRCVGFSATRDFEHWPSAQLILVPDKIDDSWAAGQDQRTEFYGLSAFPYESSYIGFLWIFQITDGNNDGPIFCELVSSRDGINWVRQEATNGKRLPILPIGPAGSWDQGMVFTTNHPLVEGDRIKLWYGGSSATHSARVDTSRSSIGFATLRKDGFASLDAFDRLGVITTKTVNNASGTVRVNVNAAKGSFKAEVLDAAGQVLPGYGRDDCIPLTADAVDARVTWRNHAKLPEMQGGLRLRFILQNASLYSFHAGESVEIVDSEGMIGLLDNVHLGPEFTLAARVKTTQKGLFRVFSNYRGSGEFVTGELIFDADPSGKETPGLRFTVNGQSVVSKPLKFDDGKYHDFAATFDRGQVVLYLDGQEVGRGSTQLGGARLSSKQNVFRYFERPNALPEVGIHLSSELLVGSDQSERFVNYKHTDDPSARANLQGSAEDTSIERRVLSGAEIEEMYRESKTNK